MRENAVTTRAWYTTGEVAALSGHSTEWVRGEIYAGRLRAFIYQTRPGGRRSYRIQVTEWRRYLAEHRRRSDLEDW